MADNNRTAIVTGAGKGIGAADRGAPRRRRLRRRRQLLRERRGGRAGRGLDHGIGGAGRALSAPMWPIRSR